MNTVSLEKRFFIENFLERFSVSNKKRIKIKKLIIHEFSILTNTKLIEPNFKLLNKNKSLVERTRLTSLLITKSHSIYFYEKKPVFDP